MHSTKFSAASIGISSGSDLIQVCPLSLNLPSPAVPRLAAGYRPLSWGSALRCHRKLLSSPERSFPLTTAPSDAEPAVCRPAIVSAWERKFCTKAVFNRRVT